jgi:hypothetical protein
LDFQIGGHPERSKEEVVRFDRRRKARKTCESVKQTTGRIVEWVLVSMVIDIRGTLSIKRDRFPGLDIDVELTKTLLPD